MLLTLILLILFLSTSFAQTYSPHYQSYAFALVISDTITSEIKTQEIPKVNVGDIVGQLAASPISGIILAVLGGLGGYIIEPSSNDGPSLPIPKLSD